MKAISYHDTVNDLQDLDWPDAGPFARLQWFALLEEFGAKPFYAIATQNGEAIALSLCRTQKGLEALTNWYTFTWTDLRTCNSAYPAMLTALARDLRKHTYRVTLSKVPDEDGTRARLTESFRESGWLVRAEACDTNHVLPLDGRSYQQVLAGRPGPLRTTLKRKAKKVAVSVSTCFEASDWQAYEDIYADSWKPAEGDPALLRAFAMAESEAGRFRLGIARYQEEPVAAQFWTVDQGTAYIHKLAHRTSADRLSPGTTLTAALFERVIDTDGVQLVDFGTGNDPYKRDWMEQVRTRWQLTCFRTEDPRNWLALAKLGLRNLVSPGAGG